MESFVVVAVALSLLRRIWPYSYPLEFICFLTCLPACLFLHCLPLGGLGGGFLSFLLSSSSTVPGWKSHNMLPHLFAYCDLPLGVSVAATHEDGLCCRSGFGSTLVQFGNIIYLESSIIHHVMVSSTHQAYIEIVRLLRNQFPLSFTCFDYYC